MFLDFFKVFLEPLNWFIYAIHNAGDYSFSFFSWLISFVWVLRPLHKIINFFVLWSICPSSSLVCFKNDPEYLTMRFLLQSLISWSFLVLISSFLFLCLFLFVCWCPIPKFPCTSNFSSLEAFWSFLDLTLLFFPLFIISMTHFSMTNSIRIS